MTIEEEIFQDCKINFSQLAAYGFKKKAENYVFEKMTACGQFKIVITVTSAGKVEGKIYDLPAQEEFVTFRVKSAGGPFISAIKAEYTDLLTDIKEKCFLFPRKVQSWVVPANPKLFDVIAHFKAHDTIIWKQPIDVHVKDTVYIYMGSPYSCILFKCEAIKVNFLENGRNTMELKHLRTYENDQYPLKKLQELGLKGVRSPRSLPAKVSDFLNQSLEASVPQDSPLAQNRTP